MDYIHNPYLNMAKFTKETSYSFFSVYRHLNQKYLVIIAKSVYSRLKNLLKFGVVKRIDIVLDRYFKESLKKQACQGISKGTQISMQETMDSIYLRRRK